MKKIFTLLIFLWVLSNLFGQAPTTSGSLTGDETWTTSMSPIHVTGDVTVPDGITLTINPGVTIQFDSGISLIIIGSLRANGSSGSGNQITFTASGSSWGHIYFNNSTGTSSLSHCLVEKGNATNLNPTYGGGMLVSTTISLNISYCEFRDNSAGWGGGVLLFTGSNTTISNCTFRNNSSIREGAGLYINTESNSLITNCLFYSNNASGNGGGIFIGADARDVKIINCTIAQNSANLGSNIVLAINNDPIYKPSFRNCIIWGSTLSINYYVQDPATSDFINCAIQDPVSGSTTNCITLNSSNTNTNGPHFVDPSNSEYSISFLSPCRDAGSSTIPAISNDFIGNPRIGTYDIGAYEVQYSLWNGSTDQDWSTASNWEHSIIPSVSLNAVIAAGGNSPRITSSNVGIDNLIINSTASLSVFNARTLTAADIKNYGSLTINYQANLSSASVLNESNLTMEQGAKATITSLTNNGTINLNSIGGEPIPSLMIDGYAGTGTANIAMHLFGNGGTNAWNWHYVAVPVDYIGDLSVFTGVNAYNLMQYDDSQIPNTTNATDNDGWGWFDGYNGTQGFSDLLVGHGYAFYHSASSNFVNFTGVSSLLTSLGTIPLQYSGTGKLVPSNYGFNLLGNSLTCGLDWDLVTLNGAVNSSVYYTIGYKIGSYVQGSGGYGINGATKNIPPLQGFLVKATAASTSINFTNARQHTTQLRYKKGLEVNGNDQKDASAAPSLVKLELNNSGNQDETLIWFNQNATNTFDRNYDGLKLLSTGYDQIYTLEGSNKFGINGIPYPAEEIAIPVSVKFLKAGTGYKIIASQLQGLEDYNVTLTDKANSNFVTDLKNTNTYIFSSEAGTFPDRFILTIGTIATGSSDVIHPNKPFNVFSYNKTLNIDLLNEAWDGKSCILNVYNLTGRPVLQNNKIELYKGDLKKIPLNLPQGLYIVEIKAENQKFVSKINIIK